MPVVLRYKGFRYFFYSNQGDPREPVHVHVRGGGSEAKFWLHPELRLASSTGMDAATLRELIKVTRDNFDLIIEAWHEHFGTGGEV